MSNDARGDIATRFKKGVSGNPKGRPKARPNSATIVSDALFQMISVNEAGRVRSLPKLAVAIQVCMNKALKGDVRAFVKLMEIAEKYRLISPEPIVPQKLTVRHIIVDPKVGEIPMPGNVGSERTVRRDS